jgi:hypothetical protein
VLLFQYGCRKADQEMPATSLRFGDRVGLARRRPFAVLGLIRVTLSEDAMGLARMLSTDMDGIFISDDRRSFAG